MIGIPDATNGNQRVAARLQPYLRPGEELLWCGRPTTELRAMTGPPAPGTGIPTMGPPTSRRVAPGRIWFADVANPEVMLAAINQAKSVLCAPLGERVREASVDRVRN
jgi:hypothetical protein